MKKRWPLILLLLVLSLFVLWRLGVINYLLAKTIFAPNYTERRDEDLGYDTEIVAKNLDAPWEIVNLPDGRILATERKGNIVSIEDGEKNLIHTITQVEATGEGGLLGMSLSPNFDENKKIIVYYTYRNGGEIWNRVSSFTFESDTLTDEQIILDQIPGSRFHNGGRIKFGPDEKLYVTTGDAQDPDNSQNIDSLAGKILRLNEDGSIPEDNPYAESPVYAYGLRNPQGISWNPNNRDLYASDHGSSKHDEVNLILPGENYGWPLVTCENLDTDYQDPLVCYSDFTMAPSGMAFDLSQESDNPSIYLAGLRGSALKKISIDSKGELSDQQTAIADVGRIRTAVYHEGFIYIATNNTDGRGVPNQGDDKIIRFRP